VVFTGTQLANEAGLPTQAQDFLTHKYFKEHPDEAWKLHYEFKKV